MQVTSIATIPDETDHTSLVGGKRIETEKVETVYDSMRYPNILQYERKETTEQKRQGTSGGNSTTGRYLQ